MKQTSPPLFIITGPTGVGKTDVSLKLAHALNGEIINCDVGQFYAPLALGTAKPDWKNEHIPHHGFDIITEPENFTVTAYHELVLRLVADIQARNKTPILVGGSGFYVYSLFFPPRDTEIEDATISVDFSPHATADLWQQLHTIDPARAIAITPNDRYRIERALQIWYATGEKPSTQKPVYNPVVNNVHVIHITRDRAELYQRINERTEIMLRDGWLDEVLALSPAWRTFLKTKKLIGYPEIIELLESTYNKKENISPEAYAELIETIQQKTRHYAKRQLTLWHMLQKHVEQHAPGSCSEFNLTASALDVYINQLLSQYPKVD